MQSKSSHRHHGLRLTLVSVTAVLAIVGLTRLAAAQAFPTGLFAKQAPGGAMPVAEARKTAQVGKPVVLRGVIGGPGAPFADKYAIFLIADKSLATCSDGCGNDYCAVPRDKLVANLAMIQVVDGTGKPLKATLQGANGLKPASDVTVKGIVSKRDDNVLIVNALNIFVNK